MHMEQNLENQMLLWEDSPVKTSPLRELARVFLETDQDSSSSLPELLTKLDHECLCLKTSLVFFPAREERTWKLSSERWLNSGMASPTGFLTLNTSESPNDGVVCSLSEVLVMDAPPKYSLSPKACKGVLNRADARGKQLPVLLRQGLESVAQETVEQNQIS